MFYDSSLTKLSKDVYKKSLTMKMICIAIPIQVISKILTEVQTITTTFFKYHVSQYLDHTIFAYVNILAFT